MNPYQHQRLHFIDTILKHYGGIKREVLQDMFGIAPAQATRDFKSYQSYAPDNMICHNRSLGYQRTDDFKPLFEKK